MRQFVGFRRFARTVVTAMLVVFFPLAGAGVATAHVTVVSPDSSHGPETIEKGGYSNVTFRVPNEEEAADTVEVRVHFPSDTPVATASVEPVPGWDADITTATLDEPVDMGDASVTEAVNTITWTAGDEGTAPGEFQRFTVSLGGVPTNTERLELPTVQTYDDDTVVKWNESSDPDGGEPEHPAPSLELVENSEMAAAKEGDGSDRGAATDDEAAVSDGADPVARWLGGLALALVAVGSVVVAVADRRRRGGSV